MMSTPQHVGRSHSPDSLESEALLRGALAQVRARLGVDVVTVLRLDPASQHLVTVLTEGAKPVTAVHHRVPVGVGLAGRIAMQGLPVALEDVGDDDLVNPAFTALAVRSVLGVPVFHEGRLTGVLKVGSVERTSFSTEAVADALLLAGEVSDALEAFYAATELAAAAALQRSLVPSSLPRIDGLDLSGRYIPGEGGVSGDWYDVFELPGDRVGMVMGDVAGHGLQASVVMGRLRSALRAYALEYDDPAEVLKHLDAKIVHFEPGAMATAIYAVTQPPFTHLHLSTAGHFLPIRVPADGAAHQLDADAGLPLGVDPGLPRGSEVVELAERESLVMFTDGLVERRTFSTALSAEVFASIDTALETLTRLLRPADADTLAARALDSMLTIEPPGDDVAVLVVRRAGRSTA
jgi:putative methionine-R-sulfoxide reductase with GAF domain